MQVSRHILLIEDDLNLSEEIRECLEFQGFELTHSETIADAEEQLKCHEFGILLVDLTLPDGDGLSLIQKQRSEGDPSVVIIAVTARSAVEDRIECVNEGVDAFLCKPLDLRELGAVVKRQLDRVESISRASHEPTQWTLDAVKSALNTPSGVPIVLGCSEYLLVEALLEARGRPVTREDLAGRIYPGQDCDNRRIDNLVTRLRQKLQSVGIKDDILRTLRGYGYLFQVSANTQQS
ncbi:two-component system, OmpR family, phosphate regulon response regulator PhoB/two-component system, OmpR family, response regulator QseB [Ectothiorhodosinus mongolicus]|uniref:Two-component system, OmpR family, phosphate regulon response regulator PhoB/two-component system, OmpR family, response regulator QseB n=1 Tax=Ectothiorhodosinus mongolicus TaxID=233100 RepID=A0A1R3VML3_9GAMM|nr:response regulator transcription factor [Ectothiorhodosinus mongolicus]ULX57857.1 DNA-binding response regulator [Ectothiorhodosinus mongolicus]SIT65734.1 two-component system, OmpR family, phosphate regulon response regulator PhoB/two-component system, OmpR family, response regulator QseB [Ectothiorhodosinus mongolicus]